MRYWIIGLLLAQAGCIRTPPPALSRAAEYLWRQQAEDGGWHSRAYGLLRSGQSLTPFVLEALLQVPEAIYPPPHAKIERAVAFIRSNTQADGSVGMSDPSIPDYPSYSTALSASALCLARLPGWDDQVHRMVEFLRRQQFTEQNGWSPQDPAYGAWGMGGGRRTPPNTGHVDLSMTRYAIEALRAAVVPPSDPAFACARIFVERCQNLEDGGFSFTTTEFDTNKSGHDGKRYRSYGTTTADGILALLATGLPRGHERLVAARRWLTGHHRDIDVPGFVGEAHQRWPRGLSFYYAAASAKAFRALGETSGRSVVGALERRQRQTDPGRIRRTWLRKMTP